MKISMILRVEIFENFIWTESKVEKSQKLLKYITPFAWGILRNFLLSKKSCPINLLITLKTTCCGFTSALILAQSVHCTLNKFHFLISFSHAFYQTPNFWNPIPVGAPLPIGLLDAWNAQFSVEAKEIVSTDTEVSTALKEKHRVKCGQCAVYNEVLRPKIGQYATMKGNSAAAKRFTSELGRPVNESTVHSIKK